MGDCSHTAARSINQIALCEFVNSPKELCWTGQASVLVGTLSAFNSPKMVVVKVLHKPDHVAREGWIWNSLLPHSHIAELMGVATLEHHMGLDLCRVLVSRHYARGNLSDYLAKLDPGVADHLMRFQLLLGVIHGLEHIHSQSIIHGDLKGTNVLVDEQGSPRICDFGSSWIECPCYKGPLKQPGTPAWCSPERWWPTATRSTKQSDIWSFGCVALEVQMGLLPWNTQGTNNMVNVRVQQFCNPEGSPATASNPELNLEQHPVKTEVWNLMMQCWKFDPQQRPTAAKLLEQMQNLNLVAV